MKLTRNAPEMEMAAVPECFADSIGRIDDGGPVTYLSLCTRQVVDRRTMRIVTLRLIVPTAELERIARQLLTRDAETEEMRDDVAVH